MIKHKPPQPLPFVLRGDAKQGTIVDAKKEFVDEIPFESWGEDAKRLRDTVRYWVRAGNAYPQLVAFVRAMAHQSADARVILKNIGEGT